MYDDPILIGQRVAAGAVWLDKNTPGWPARVDPDRIRVADPFRCPLGQLYGDFYAAPFPSVGADPHSRADLHGFDADDPDVFDQLDAEWARLVTARRTVAVTGHEVYGIECTACGGRERNVATDPDEARRVADQHVCDGEALQS
jgi:hypothetical protein